MHRTIVLIGLSLFAPHALAHNTEGLAALLLAMIGWPTVIVICTALGKQGTRLAVFIISALSFPATIYFANRIAQRFAEGSWSSEYAITSALTATAWLAIVIAMATAAIRRGRRRKAEAQTQESVMT